MGAVGEEGVSENPFAPRAQAPLREHGYGDRRLERRVDRAYDELALALDRVARRLGHEHLMLTLAERDLIDGRALGRTLEEIREL